MRIAYSDELELYPASKMQDISKHSHNAKLTLRFYAHNENYVISYGLFRASHSHNPAKHSHNAKLTLHFYAHIWAGQEVMKPLLCKHIVVSDL